MPLTSDLHPVIADLNSPQIKGFSRERSGVKVVLENRGEASPRDTYAIGIRGFNLANRYLPEVIEPNVFDFAWVEARCSQRKHGLSLVKGLADVAIGEGFALARADIRSPKALSILERLTAMGMLETLGLYPSHRTGVETVETPLLTPTQELITLGHSVSYDATRAFHADWEASNPAKVRGSGLTNATVEGVFRLK